MAELPRALTSSHRDFLLSVARAEPAWDLMPFAHLHLLPAIRWKLLNLEKLKQQNPKRFDAQHHELVRAFDALPQSPAPELEHERGLSPQDRPDEEELHVRRR
jgi:hypothetical protein